MAILITGANGFVGTNVSRYLTAQGLVCIALDIAGAPEQGAYAARYTWDGLEAIPWREVDAVIHLAGKAHDTKNTSDPQSYFDINVGLTKKILEKCANAGETPRQGEADPRKCANAGMRECGNGGETPRQGEADPRKCANAGMRECGNGGETPRQGGADPRKCANAGMRECANGGETPRQGGADPRKCANAGIGECANGLVAEGGDQRAEVGGQVSSFKFPVSGLSTKGQKKFIFFSSVKACADTVEGVLTEDAQPMPQTPYGKSKLEAEKEVRECANAGIRECTDALACYILRPAMIHGPGNKGNLNLLVKVVQKGIPWLLGAFENQRSFTSIENVSRVLEALIKTDVEPGTYQVADDETLSTNQVIGLIAESLGRTPRIWKIAPGLMRRVARIGDVLHLPLNSERLKKLTESYVVSNRKLLRALGWQKMPVSAQEGMRATLIATYCDH